MGANKYSDLDREIVVISAVWDLIGSMVNYALFIKDHRLDEPFLQFNTREGSRLFIIMMADFLSLPSEGTFGLKISKGATDSLGETYLGHLADIAGRPHFNGNTEPLAKAVQAFAVWLDGTVTVDKVWLPSIEREGPLTVQRKTYLKICGTITKHGFTRLGNTVNQIQKVLADNGTKVDLGQAYLVIPEFQEWFRDHVFIASVSILAWHLNEVRWALYRYLLTEFTRAYTPTGDMQGLQMYRFDVPAAINLPLIRSMYWDLMNSVRSPPYFPQFSPQRYLLREF